MILAATHRGRIIVMTSALLGIGCSTAQVPAGETPNSKPPVTTVEISQCDIAPAIAWMDKQDIIYTQSPSDEWRDCSGNFLRLSSRIASICPDLHLAAPAGVKVYERGGSNKRPGLEEARTTRGLAKWYDDKDLFVPIYYDGTDPMDAPESLVALRNKINTGTVLWFSPKVPLASGGKAGLYDEQVRGAINHMGTVVSVTRDGEGNVTGWDMYHGQNKKKNNGITSHYWERTGITTLVPMGGYGRQRIVGFAESIIPPATL